MRFLKQTRGVHFVIGYQLSCRYLVKSISQQDIDLATTMLQMPYGMGGYGMTPNVIAQISAKVAMASRFLGFVGSLSSSEQQLWFPNQNVQDQKRLNHHQKNGNLDCIVTSKTFQRKKEKVVVSGE